MALGLVLLEIMAARHELLQVPRLDVALLGFGRRRRGRRGGGRSGIQRVRVAEGEAQEEGEKQERLHCGRVGERGVGFVFVRAREQGEKAGTGAGQSRGKVEGETGPLVLVCA